MLKIDVCLLIILLINANSEGQQMIIFLIHSPPIAMVTQICKMLLRVKENKKNVKEPETLS